MAMKLSENRKTVVLIASLVAVVIVAVLIGVLVTCSNSADEPEQAQEQQELAPETTDDADDSAESEETEAPREAIETSYAYIVKRGEGTGGQTNLAFDFVDWLHGTEAVNKFMQDNPGISKKDAEREVEEFGYIRNVNPKLRWFSTTKDTVFLMPDDSMSVEPIEVTYQAFKDKMLPAIDANDTSLTFVEVTVSGESITKIEWVYHP